MRNIKSPIIQNPEVDYGAGSNPTYVNEFGETVVNETLPQPINIGVNNPKSIIKENLKSDLGTGTSIIKEPEIVSQNKLVQEVTNIEAEKSKSNNINSNFKKYYLVGGIILLTAIVSFFIFKRKKNE